MTRLRYLGWNFREVTRSVLTLTIMLFLGFAGLAATMGWSDQRRGEMTLNVTILILMTGATLSVITALRCSLVIGPDRAIVTNVYRRKMIPLEQICGIGLTFTSTTSRPVVAIRSEQTRHGLVRTTPVFAVSDHFDDAVRAFEAVGLSFAPEAFFLVGAERSR